MRLLLLLACSIAYACTDFVVRAKDGTLVNGRTLEFAMELSSMLKIFPRGQKIVSQGPNGQAGITWVSKYGFLGVTALGKNLSMDGLNEAGLSFGYLWLPGYTQYPAPEGNVVDLVDFGAWILGNFSNVGAVKEALKGITVWGHAVPPLPGIPPVHVAIHDAQGGHLVVEFVRGKMQIYDNPTTVLTNSPPFDWQLVNLSNYTGLTAYNADPMKINGATFTPPGQGSGLLGIPGDYTPPSRFVKIVTSLRFAKQTMNAMEAVNLAEHLLNTVDIPMGMVREKGKEGGDYTQWAIIKDLTHKVFYFRSYNDLTLKKIDLNKVNWNSTKAISLETKKGYIDMTATFASKESLAVCRGKDE
jgi:choloylglycine hydrolase